MAMCGEQWLETGNPFVEVVMSESQIEWLITENKRLTVQNEQLVRDLHRIDSARQNAVNHGAVLANEVNRLTDENDLLKKALNEVRDE